VYVRAGVDFMPLAVEVHGDLRYFFEVSEEVGIGCAADHIFLLAATSVYDSPENECKYLVFSFIQNCS
jgi:hypothetical protein